MNRAAVRQWILLLISFLCIAGRVSAAKTSVDLTKEERQWLKEHKTIRVANQKNWIPLDFYVNETPEGFSVEYMNVLGRMLGVKIEYVTGPSFGEFLGMARERRIDVVMSLAQTEERSAYLDFTEPYFQNIYVIVSRTDESYTDLEELRGKTVSVPDQTVLQNFLETEYPEIHIKAYKDFANSIFAVGSGEADAALAPQPIVQFLIREFFLSNLSISGGISKIDPSQQEFRFGVRNDWPLLAGCLQKAMDAFPPEELARIRNTWLAQGAAEEIQPESSGIESYQILTVVILGITLLYLGSIFILKHFNINIRKIGWRRIRIIFVVSLILYIGMVAVISVLSLKKIQREVKESGRLSMELVLKNADGFLSKMIGFNLQILSENAKNPRFGELVRNLLRNENEDGGRINRSVLEEYLSDSFPWGKQAIYCLIDGNLDIIASNTAGYVGSRPDFIRRNQTSISQVFEGFPQFLTPMSVPGPDGALISREFFLVPCPDEEGEIIAVLASSFDPMKTLSVINENFNFAISGETYSFNKEGILVTKSRYADRLETLELIEPGTGGALQVEIRNPGVNLLEAETLPSGMEKGELTRMAQSALRGNFGYSMEGYKNYMGIPVFGAWLWNKTLNYGLATEIPVDQAMTQYRKILGIIIPEILFAVILAGGITLMSLYISGKAIDALHADNADLETRVKERTAELSHAKEDLENTLTALTQPFFVVDTATYEVVLANKAAKEWGRENTNLCYEFIRYRENPCDKEGSRCPIREVVRTKKPVIVEHIITDKYGKKIAFEIYGYPVLNEEGEVIRMIEYAQDITDRKIAQQKIKEHEEQLEALIETAPDSLLIVDNERRIIQINHRTELLFGYERADLIGRPLEILFCSPLPEIAVRESLTSANTNEGWNTFESFEISALNKNGKSFPVEISFSSRNYLNRTLTQYQIRDITQRKADEEILKGQMEELELFNRLTIGREEKMIELKKEVNEFLRSMNLPEKYSISPEGEETC